MGMVVSCSPPIVTIQLDSPFFRLYYNLFRWPTPSIWTVLSYQFPSTPKIEDYQVRLTVIERRGRTIWVSWGGRQVERAVSNVAAVGRMKSSAQGPASNHRPSSDTFFYVYLSFSVYICIYIPVVYMIRSRITTRIGSSYNPLLSTYH